MQKRFRIALATLAAATLTSGLLTAAAGTAAAAPSGTGADFNNDGYADIAVSSPTASVAGKNEAGQVTVLYGSPEGIGSARRTTISQNSAGVPGTAETGDRFGFATAAGDFDADGFTDLAVGAAHEQVGDDVDGGTVQIIWGSVTGLAGGVTINDPAPTAHDRFGVDVAAGDFDNDGRTDLVTGDSSSSLRLFKGGISRYGKAASTVLVPTPILGGGKDGGTYKLTSGDVTHDGKDDLVVNGYEGTSDAEYLYNANYYLPGAASGLDPNAARKLPGGVITDIGDVNGDGYGDLVTGLSWDKDVPGTTKGGKVNVIYGSASGPTSEMDSITQESGTIPGGSETGDSFGLEVSLGDINGDGLQDLAIGAPSEDLSGVTDTGSVTVVYGSTQGLDTTNGVQYFHQEVAGVPGTGEAYDFFGSEVFLSDLNGDGKADLTVGAIGENDGNGSVVAFNSDGSALTTAGARSVSPSAVGVDTAYYPQFGAVMAG